MNVQWLTTAPNPRTHTSVTSPDAGQRGWRIHAVEADSSETLSAVRGRAALCGLTPRHGWGVDLFIDEQCKRCKAKATA